MAKQGQHHKDGNDPDVSRGRNNPRKSTPITTGTPKKRATYKKQEFAHENPEKLPQDQEPHWYESTPKKLSKKDIVGDSNRTGSESNASN